jgi:hypothetical protein
MFEIYKSVQELKGNEIDFEKVKAMTFAQFQKFLDDLLNDRE